MAKPNPTASGRPVAPHVDPATPVPDASQGDGVTKTQDAKTLVQEDQSVAEDANPVVLNDESPNLTKEDDNRTLPGNGGTGGEVEKVTVRTKGAHLLMDPFSAHWIDNRGEGVEVPVTSFINDELAEGGRLEKA